MTEQTLHENAVNDKNLDDLHGKIKAILNSSLSDGAKFAALAEAVGARGAEEIAAVVKKPIRTVERHYAELRRYRQLRKSAGTQNCGTHDCVVPQICVEKPANLRTETTQNCVVASHAPADITTRATNELPSEVSSYEEVDSPSSVPPTSKTKPAKGSVRGSRLPKDWQLPNDWRQWTRINFATTTDEMVDAEAEHFRDYWIAKTGSTATKLDWQATWRNWCRNSKTLTRINAPHPYSAGRMAYDEKKAAGALSWQDERRRRNAEAYALATGGTIGHG